MSGLVYLGKILLSIEACVKVSLSSSGFVVQSLGIVLCHSYMVDLSQVHTPSLYHFNPQTAFFKATLCNISLYY